jgi:hypothetical protein
VARLEIALKINKVVLISKAFTFHLSPWSVRNQTIQHWHISHASCCGIGIYYRLTTLHSVVIVTIAYQKVICKKTETYWLLFLLRSQLIKKPTEVSL